MKKLFTFFLALAAGAVTLFAESGTCGPNLTWDLTNGVLTISGTGDMTDYSNGTVAPWWNYRSSIETVVIEDGVTSIASYACFYGYSELTSVIIPNSVTKIGENAFYGCTGLNSITIPKNVTSIGEFAFQCCSGATSIKVDSDNTKYDSRKNCNAIIETATNKLVTGCNATVIPNSVKVIGANAFDGCSGLTSITIPGSVEEILDNAFIGCSGLASVTISKSVTNIGVNIFSYCNALTSIKVDSDNTKYDSRNNCNAIIETATNKLIVGCVNTFIPGTVTSIGKSAFAYCSLTSITIPQDVTYISHWAFRNCRKLAFIICKAPTPPTCEKDCFSGVNKDITIYVPKGKVEDYEGKDPWLDFSDIQEIPASGQCGPNITWTLAGGVLTLSGTGFMSDYEPMTAPWTDYRSSIKSIVIEDGITRIFTTAFQGLDNLTSVVIPGSVKHIPAGIFYNYNSPTLTSVTIHDGVEEIGDGAFELCSGLTTLNIPNSVTEIGKNAFKNVLNINYKGTATGSPWGARAVNGYVDGYLVYTNDAKTSLRACSLLAEGELYIPFTVKSIDPAAFAGCSGLTFVGIPEGVTAIDDYTFSGCSGLISAVIGENVQTIGEEAFSGCSSLGMIVCSALTPPNWTGSSATTFKDVDMTLPLYVPAEALETYKAHTDWKKFTNIQPIPFETISGTCGDNLTWELTFGGELNISGTGAMTDYNNTSSPFKPYRSFNMSLVIEDGATSIGKYAFYECSKMTSVTIPSSVKSINNHAFLSCTGLKQLVMPDGVESIMNYAFNGCAGLTSLTIPATVTLIGGYAFGDCTGLKSITCEATTPPECLTNPFDNVDKTIPLYVPYGTKAAYKAAKEWKAFTNIIEMTPTGIESIEPAETGSRKVLHNGQIYLLYDGRMYDVQGRLVR